MKTTPFTWTAAKLNNHERIKGNHWLCLNRNQLFRGKKTVLQPNDQRMPNIKITKEERLGLIPADPVCRK
jgi:hypothetical protein